MKTQHKPYWKISRAIILALLMLAFTLATLLGRSNRLALAQEGGLVENPEESTPCFKPLFRFWSHTDVLSKHLFTTNWDELHCLEEIVEGEKKIICHTPPGGGEQFGYEGISGYLLTINSEVGCPSGLYMGFKELTQQQG